MINSKCLYTRTCELAAAAAAAAATLLDVSEFVVVFCCCFGDEHLTWTCLLHLH